MRTQRSKEGWLLLDNRHAPGPGDVRFLEAATITCSHCSQVMIRNPERTRERAWCRSCDHYICDPCSVAMQTGVCVPMAKRLEDGQTAAFRALWKG